MSKTISKVDKYEENVIALLLGLMTAITFVNVIVRYGFNSNILWGLEATVFLFAWLVLLGSSYLVKLHAHIGVDVVIDLFKPTSKRLIGLFAAVACIFYAALLLKGSWDYWANFANLPATTGRWFPTGFEKNYLAKGWYEVESVPLPSIFAFLQDLFNDGEEYEKIPRFIPYAVLPLSMILLLYRYIQSFNQIMQGKISAVIISFELEDDTKTTKKSKRNK